MSYFFPNRKVDSFFFLPSAVRSEVNDLRLIVNKLKEEIDDLGETIDQFEQENER